MAGKTISRGSAEEVLGARQTLTITALVEGIYFGLGFLLIPSILINLISTLEATPLEVFHLRSIGAMALALGVGCWLSRDGSKDQVKIMSAIMSIAKIGTTIVIIAMLVSVDTFLITGWTTPIITGFLAVINFRQFLAVKKE